LNTITLLVLLFIPKMYKVATIDKDTATDIIKEEMQCAVERRDGESDSDNLSFISRKSSSRFSHRQSSYMNFSYNNKNNNKHNLNLEPMVSDHRPTDDKCSIRKMSGDSNSSGIDHFGTDIETTRGRRISASSSERTPQSSELSTARRRSSQMNSSELFSRTNSRTNKMPSVIIENDSSLEKSSHHVINNNKISTGSMEEIIDSSESFTNENNI